MCKKVELHSRKKEIVDGKLSNCVVYYKMTRWQCIVIPIRDTSHKKKVYYRALPKLACFARMTEKSTADDDDGRNYNFDSDDDDDDDDDF